MSWNPDSIHTKTSTDSSAAGAHVTLDVEDAQQKLQQELTPGQWLAWVSSLGGVCSQTEIHLFKHLTKFYSNWLSAFAGGKTKTFFF